MHAGTVTSAFLSAARFAGEVIRDPAIGEAWHRSSALERMTVGDVAGHLFLVVRRVDKRLEQTPDPTLPRLGGMIYPRVSRPEDLDLAVHDQVRLDGRHVAARGWAPLCDAYDDRIARLAHRLVGPVPDTITLDGHAIDFGEYLASRVVEVLVHADDLMASIGAASWNPPVDAVEAAFAYLIQAARRVHGDHAMLLAFTRRERVPPGAPGIY
jgi:hypothetical protein